MVTIKLSEIKKKVEEGSTLGELSEFYSLSKSQMSSVLKEANLKVSKKGYRIINDLEVQENTPIEEDQILKIEEKEDHLLVHEPDLFK